METVSADNIRPRLLLADDHTIFAEALKVFLERTYQVIGVVADGRALVEATLNLKPDVAIIDVAMPILNGFDAARRIQEDTPHCKFIFLTMRADPNLAAAALELGAIGFVLKNSAGTELLKAIDHVVHGKSYVSPQVRPDDWVTARSRARQFAKEMTLRQREIVQLCAEGRSMKEIAALLNISEKTVEFHKQHVKQACHLKSNADLILYALKQGLIFVDGQPAAELRPHSIESKSLHDYKF